MRSALRAANPDSRPQPRGRPTGPRRARAGIFARSALGLALVGTVALSGCIPVQIGPIGAGPRTPVVAPSPLAGTPTSQAIAAPGAEPLATPAATPTPDPLLATIAHLAPAERIDDQTGADADWPVAVVDPSLQTPTPVTKTVPQTTTHVVRKGETLSSIAAASRVSVDSIVKANGLPNANTVYAGQRLAIPTGKMVTVTEGTRAAATLEPHFIWPARAPITTYFDEKGSIWKGGWHTGLDIGALYGTPIVAAESGLVVEAGWATTRGFGNYVKLDNGLGYITLYGHMSVIRVKEGQYVNRGDRIGDVGSTGVSTGPHLHFELRLNGQPIDPLPYLPK